MRNKKILFVTGTRADYGKLKPLITAVERHNDFEAYIFVSGMHLLKKFGSTYREILKSGYKNIHVAFEIEHSDSMSENFGHTVISLTQYINAIRPNMIVVHGDRIDALAGASAGALNNMLVAHVEGGEISGTIDESIRHSISKFAHIHFTCNGEATSRLVQMGENKDSIIEIGSPDIDIMLSHGLPSLERVKKHYEIDFQKYSILMYHPVTTELDRTKSEIREIVQVLKDTKWNYIVIYPNNDTGNEIILKEYQDKLDAQQFRIFPSLSFESFLVLLKNSQFLIGNSSAGVREAGVYGVPVIDIGNRQMGRYSVRNALNIQHINANREELLEALSSYSQYRHISNTFGHGNSTQLFMKFLESGQAWATGIQKRFIDVGETI